MNKADVVGSWKLVHYKIFLGDEIIFPFGEDALGYLIYTDDGFMSVQFMRAQRSKHASDDFQHFLPSEKVEIAENFGGYAGRYETSTGQIIHYPEIASLPNFAYAPQIRNCELRDSCLWITCPYYSEEKQTSGLSEIVWERVKSP
jgi:hypothetical protein